MYEINFEIPAFLLSLLCFVYCVTAKHRQYIPPKTIKNRLLSQHYVFLLMLVTNMLSSLSSVVGVYLTSATFEGVGVWQYLFHAFYFIFHTTLSVTFTLYIMNVTGTGVNWKRRSYVLFSLPYIASELLVLTNSFTKWAFYMDENLVYHRGTLMPLLYAIGVFYLALGTFFFFKNKKAISRVDSIAVGAFIIIATIGIIVQAVISAFLVELFSEALACLVLMIVLEEKSGHMDITTGLLNRVAFADNNRRMMISGQEYCIVLVKLTELDKFIKKFGGREADAFLIGVAEFLVKESGVVDVYCYRREAFAVTFKGAATSEAQAFVDKVLDRFNKEWAAGSMQIKAEAVVSLIRVPEDIGSFSELENLVSSNYKKKKGGSYFVPIEEIRELTKQGFYETALKKAIAENKLMLKYQPIWSVEEQKTVSCEALLRVDCDELRDISPEVYIPIAEKTGLIKDIGLFVFEEVCRFLKNERIKNSGIKYVELNLSVFQFMYDDLFDRFENIRKNYDIDAEMINLEITETALASDEQIVIKTLGRFYDLGYSLSLDDFGTGYSNLIRMVGSRYKNIKIDKSILWNITRNGSDPKVLKNLVGFIKSLGFDIIQEGVETKEQLELVKSCGCDFAQGYYFSVPIPENEFVGYMKSE